MVQGNKSLYLLLFNWDLQDGVHELSKKLVIRMDILPHIESIAIQKVGFGGCVSTSIVPVNDLEYTTY